MKEPSNNLMNLTEDPRPAKNGWAPGNYIPKCISCKKNFIGDKRAYTCAECAYSHCVIEKENTKDTCLSIFFKVKIAMLKTAIEKYGDALKDVGFALGLDHVSSLRMDRADEAYKYVSEILADIVARHEHTERDLENKTAYAEKLAEGLPCLPKDIEVLRTANAELAEENFQLKEVIAGQEACYGSLKRDYTRLRDSLGY